MASIWERCIVFSTDTDTDTDILHHIILKQQQQQQPALQYKHKLQLNLYWTQMFI